MFKSAPNKWAIAFFLVLLPATFAQRTSGTITGLVTDPTRSVGVQREVRELSNNRTLRASAAGSYTICRPLPWLLFHQGFGRVETRSRLVATDFGWRIPVDSHSLNHNWRRCR